MNMLQQKEYLELLQNSKSVIYVETKKSSIDQFAINRILKSNKIEEIFSPFFFNPSLSIKDNFKFHCISSGISEDVFDNEFLSIIKNLPRLPKEECDQNLWDFVAIITFFKVIKGLKILNYFPFPDNSPRFKSLSSNIEIQKLSNIVKQISEENKYVFFTNSLPVKAQYFEQFFVFNEQEFIGCYNDFREFRSQVI
tara:strand:+ start:1550 stop:2137 length:588 start_codon:yes stop_codon:yes gene_type:complete